MGLTKAILKFAAPLPKIEEQKRFLFIGPHPDDIEIGAGATAAKLVDMGKEVRFLVCIDGRFGTGNAPEGIDGDKLVALRQEEAEKSAAMLGVTDVHFLGLKDGGFYEQKDLLLGIAKEVGDFAPDVIFAPDPCVISECTSSHIHPAGTLPGRVWYPDPDPHKQDRRSPDFHRSSLSGSLDGDSPESSPSFLRMR